jgi:transcriptional regulator with XRE-family HTH domain
MARGGRRELVWKLLTGEQLKAWRLENGVSRARLAQILGVSSTSVQNWETGTVATMRTQQRLAELMKAPPAAIPPRRRAPSLWDAGGQQQRQQPVVDPTLTAVGTIVSEYLKGAKGLGGDELVSLITAVRQALS